MSVIWFADELPILPLLKSIAKLSLTSMEERAAREEFFFLDKS